MTRLDTGERLSRHRPTPGAKRGVFIDLVRGSAQLMRQVIVASVFMIIVSPLVPLVAGDHMDPIDETAGDRGFVTHENDAAVVVYPGSPLDGEANRVSPVGATPGDGSLFLDHYLVGQNNRVTSAARSLELYGNGLLPGMYAHAVWYGWWTDIDSDGRIDDNHDAHCVSPETGWATLAAVYGTLSGESRESRCAADEFKWRGTASGDQTPMYGWQVPATRTWGFISDYVPAYWPAACEVFVVLDAFSGDAERAAHQAYDCLGPMFSPYMNRGHGAPAAAFGDRTALTEFHQGYRSTNGFETLYLDEGFLATVYFVVAADVPFDVNGQIDRTASGVLVDVDVHESLGPDVESLYYSTAIGTRAAYHATVSAAFAPVGPAVEPIEEVVVIIDDFLVDLLGDPETTIIEASETNFNVIPGFKMAQSALHTPYPKEPNTAEDAYDFATFGGSGGLLGEGNDYSAYASEWLLFGDVAGDFRHHENNVGLALSLVNIFTDYNGFTFSPGSWDPYNANGDPEQRGPAPRFGVSGVAYAWNDANGDGWVGNPCSSSYRWSCEDPYNEGSYMYGNRWGGETRGLCDLTTMSNSVIDLVPMSGNWPDVFVARWYWNTQRHAESFLAETEIERSAFVNDGRTIQIRWDPAHAFCRTGGGSNTGIDIVYFPHGTQGFSFKTVADVTLLRPYSDSAAGVNLPAGQRFVDVDYYVAAL